MVWKRCLVSVPIIGLMVFLTYDSFGFWPSIAFFTIVFLVAEYIYAQEARNLASILKPLALKYDGVLSHGAVLSYPSLRFESEDRKYSVNSLPTAGSGSRPGPFTVVSATLPFDTGLQASVRRSPARIRGAIAAVAPGIQATTGDARFDHAFRLEGSDKTALAKLLDARLRGTLLNSKIEALDLSVKAETVRVAMDGLAKSSSEIDELIALAKLLCERFNLPYPTQA